jgi:hypothetical protein
MGSDVGFSLRLPLGTHDPSQFFGRSALAGLRGEEGFPIPEYAPLTAWLQVGGYSQAGRNSL